MCLFVKWNLRIYLVGIWKVEASRRQGLQDASGRRASWGINLHIKISGGCVRKDEAVSCIFGDTCNEDKCERPAIDILMSFGFSAERPGSRL